MIVAQSLFLDSVPLFKDPMNTHAKFFSFLAVLGISVGVFADVDTDPLVLHEVITKDQLRKGHHWTPGEANLKMKEYGGTWEDKASWEKRAAST